MFFFLLPKITLWAAIPKTNNISTPQLKIRIVGLWKKKTKKMCWHCESLKAILDGVTEEVEWALDARAASRRGSSTEAPPPHVFSLMLIYIALNIAVILPEEHIAQAKQRGYDHPLWHIFPGIRKKIKKKTRFLGMETLCPRSEGAAAGVDQRSCEAIPHKHTHTRTHHI